MTLVAFAGCGGGGGGEGTGTETTPAGPSEFHYVVSTNGTTVSAINGRTGAEEFSGSDASTVLQSVLDALGSDGGRVYLRTGTYSLAQSLQVGGGTELVGTEGTSLYSSGTAITVSSVSRVSIKKITLNGCGMAAIVLGEASDIRILQCAFVQTFGQAILHENGTLERVWISDCRIDQPGGNAIELAGVKNASIERNIIASAGGTGLAISSGSGRILVAGNQIRGSDQKNDSNSGDGISLSGNCDEVILRDNVLAENGRNGLSIQSSGAGAIIVSGNHLRKNNANKGEAGIFFDGSKGLIERNMVHEQGRSGIRLGSSATATLVRTNQVWNNGQGSAGTGHQSGIILESPAAVSDQRIQVRDNFCQDTQSTPTQQIGIEVGAACSGIVIEKNRLSGNGSAAISYPTNGGVRVRANSGFGTEARGSATVSGGSTFVTVSHGLATTPVTILLTPLSDLGVRSYWISEITGSSFRIELSATSATDLKIGWRTE